MIIPTTITLTTPEVRQLLDEGWVEVWRPDGRIHMREPDTGAALRIVRTVPTTVTSTITIAEYERLERPLGSVGDVVRCRAEHSGHDTDADISTRIASITVEQRDGVWGWVGRLERVK